MAAETSSVEVKIEEGGMAGAGSTAAEQASDKKPNHLQQQQEAGRLSARTVADATANLGKSSNPNAADQLGLDILAAFRRKVHAILMLQCLIVWGLAAGIARIPPILDRKILEYAKYKTDKQEFYVDVGIVVVAWLAALAALAVVSRYRYHWSVSLITMAIFTTLISTALGLMCGPNVIYGIGLAMGSMLLVAIPTSIRLKDRMIEILPVSMVVSVLSFIIGIVGWLMIAPHISLIWVVPTLLLNCIGMIWLGYEMDWICSCLNPDEYLLPICLVWAEIMTAVLIVTLTVLAGHMPACEQGGCMSGTWLYCHCDCWIYADGNSSRKQYYSKVQKFQEQASTGAAPAQQMMQKSGERP